jgi:hypothetical protein
MRIIAHLHYKSSSSESALGALRAAYDRQGLIECHDASERRLVMDQLIQDMSAADRDGFNRTVRSVYKHAIEGTVAAINENGGHIVLRLRNPRLTKLLPSGEALLHDVLGRAIAEGDVPLNFVGCEVREHGRDEGFLFGAWASGAPSFWRYMYAQRPVFQISITLLFIIGLVLEVGLTLWDPGGAMAELGQRLGAPMLVSSSVLILERWGNWLVDRRKRLKWSFVPVIDSELQQTAGLWS